MASRGEDDDGRQAQRGGEGEEPLERLLRQKPGARRPHGHFSSRTCARSRSSAALRRQVWVKRSWPSRAARSARASHCCAPSKRSAARIARVSRSLRSAPYSKAGDIGVAILSMAVLAFHVLRENDRKYPSISQ